MGVAVTEGMARTPSHHHPHTPPGGPPLVAARRAPALVQWLGGEGGKSSPDAARLYRQIHRRFQAGLGRHGTEAEDATQDTFLEALENRERIRKGVPEYISGVCRMKLREHYRRRARYARTLSQTELDMLSSVATDASTAVGLALEVGLLVRALQALRLDDQRCLALVYGRELRNVEAAAVLGLRKVDFDNRLGRARARLRRVLEQSESLDLARGCSWQSFQEWVVAVLGPPRHEAKRVPGVPSGNERL